MTQLLHQLVPPPEPNPAPYLCSQGLLKVALHPLQKEVPKDRGVYRDGSHFSSKEWLKTAGDDESSHHQNPTGSAGQDWPADQQGKAMRNGNVDGSPMEHHDIMEPIFRKHILMLSLI